MPERTASIDVNILFEDIYRYLRIRGDTTTRYWGGNPSDGNFPIGFDPAPGSVLITDGIGSFQQSFRSMVYEVSNEIPTVGTYDFYTVDLASGPVTPTLGFRSLVGFKVLSMGDNASLFIGFIDNHESPLVASTAGRILGFTLDREGDIPRYRAWFGTVVTSSARLFGHDIIDRNLILETRIISYSAISVAEFRLYDRDLDLDEPLLTQQVSAASTFQPRRFGISSMGRRLAGMPVEAQAVRARFEYADVDLPTGSMYTIDPEVGIGIAEAKWRPYQDRPPFVLAREGENTLWSSLSEDAVTGTIEGTDSITIDSREPSITVVEFDVDSTAVVPNTDPPIPKGSAQPGFRGVRLRWYSDVAGTWSLRQDSTSVANGTELQSGSYPTEGETVEIEFNFDDLVGGDGLHDVTLYLVSFAGVPTGKPIGEYVLPLYGVDGGAVLIDEFTIGWSGVLSLKLDVNIS